MVVLCVDVSYLIALSKSEVPQHIIYVVFASPVDEVSEHQLDVGHHELASSTESQQIVVVEAADRVEALLFNPVPKLLQN